MAEVSVLHIKKKKLTGTFNTQYSRDQNDSINHKPNKHSSGWYCLDIKACDMLWKRNQIKIKHKDDDYVAVTSRCWVDHSPATALQISQEIPRNREVRRKE